MSEHEAMQYVDLIIEKLHEWGVISEHAYGTMTENQRQELAELVSAKSQE